MGGITASITGQGLTITGAPTDNITISGTAAQRSGNRNAAAGAGAGTPVVGSSLNPKVTLLTPLASLNNGAGIDNSGLTITNGKPPKPITWSPPATVQDMLNAINGAGLGVVAQINSAGTGHQYSQFLAGNEPQHRRKRRNHRGRSGCSNLGADDAAVAAQ